MSPLGLADKVVAVDRALGGARIGHAFGGALALAYYATPRATIDIDVNVFVPVSSFGAVAAALAGVGVDDIPDEGLVAADGQARARWDATPIDLFFSYDAIHDAMRDATRTVPFGEVTIPILAPEHLLVAKVAFDRPKDWIDIEHMLIAVDELDMAEIDRWLTHLMGSDDERVRRARSMAADLRG